MILLKRTNSFSSMKNFVHEKKFSSINILSSLADTLAQAWTSTLILTYNISGSKPDVKNLKVESNSAPVIIFNIYSKEEHSWRAHLMPTLYTCWTEPSLTFDLLWLMLDETKWVQHQCQSGYQIECQANGKNLTVQNKCFQLTCLLHFYAWWLSLNDFSGLTLRLNCVTLIATELTLITFRMRNSSWIWY